MAEKPRLPAYDAQPDRVYQWYFQAIPEKISVNGNDRNNPFRAHAIYVVHGMGEQHFTDTAASLRIALEDAVPYVDPENWQPGAPNYWVVPQPFVYDGYWGNYPNIDEVAAELWHKFSDREREFFGRVWRGRAVNFDATWKWFAKNSFSLIGKAPWLAKLYYAFLFPQLLAGIAAMRFNSATRGFVTGYLNDVRLYVEPQGDMEHAIAQRIEFTVGKEFLRLLGTDYNFQDLKKTEWVTIGGTPHRFDRITWLAHSLGTVVSYKVIGDLLRRCLEERLKHAPNPPPPNVERVEGSLQVFVTMGSPLDKFRFLYGDQGLLRDWPSEYHPGGDHSLWSRPNRPENFWHNFYYTADPVSGHLNSFTCQHDNNTVNLVRNFHTRGPKPLGWAHVVYWNDRRLLTLLMNLAFGPTYVKPWPAAEKPRSKMVQSIQRIVAFSAYLFLIPLAFVALIWFGILWIKRKLFG